MLDPSSAGSGEHSVKIILVGGTGTIGRKVAERLADRHELIVAGRNSGDVRVDIGEPGSIDAMFAATGEVDAVVNIAGEAKWAALDSMSEEDFYIGIRSKLMGQVNLVRAGIEHLNPGGSFTLTTGILADDRRMPHDQNQGQQKHNHDTDAKADDLKRACPGTPGNVGEAKAPGDTDAAAES